MGQALLALRELDLLEPGEYERLRAADPFALQDVLERASGTSAEVPANSLLLRAQKRAVYLPRNDGHYALGASAYCHLAHPPLSRRNGAPRAQGAHRDGCRCRL